MKFLHLRFPLPFKFSFCVEAIWVHSIWTRTLVMLLYRRCQNVFSGSNAKQSCINKNWGAKILLLLCWWPHVMITYPTVLHPRIHQKLLAVLSLRAYFYYSNDAGPILRIELKEKCSRNKTSRGHHPRMDIRWMAAGWNWWLENLVGTEMSALTSCIWGCSAYYVWYDSWVRNRD